MDTETIMDLIDRSGYPFGEDDIDDFIDVVIHEVGGIEYDLGGEG